MTRLISRSGAAAMMKTAITQIDCRVWFIYFPSVLFDYTKNICWILLHWPSKTITGPAQRTGHWFLCYFLLWHIAATRCHSDHTDVRSSLSVFIQGLIKHFKNPRYIFNCGSYLNKRQWHGVNGILIVQTKKENPALECIYRTLICFTSIFHNISDENM